MHSNAQHAHRAQGAVSTPTGPGRVRRISAILAIGTLPLMIAACATPGGTTVGAGAGAAASSAPASASATPGESTDGSGPASVPSPGSPAPDEGTGSIPSSQEPSVPSEPSVSSEPSAGTGVPDALKGSAWTSISITGRQVVKGSPLKISFDAAGERSGLNAGCNSMGGAPIFDGDSLSIPQIVSTMMACEGGGGAIMKQESWYSKWLTEGVSATIDGMELTLDGDGVTVVFERSGDADAAPSSGTADPDQPTSSPSTDGGVTTQAEPGPVATPRTPISGATIEPGPRGSAIPIPPTTR